MMQVLIQTIEDVQIAEARIAAGASLRITIYEDSIDIDQLQLPLLVKEPIRIIVKKLKE